MERGCLRRSHPRPPHTHCSSRGHQPCLHILALCTHMVFIHRSVFTLSQPFITFQTQNRTSLPPFDNHLSSSFNLSPELSCLPFIFAYKETANGLVSTFNLSQHGTAMQLSFSDRVQHLHITWNVIVYMHSSAHRKCRTKHMNATACIHTKVNRHDDK